jgi:hypothetical protein
VGADEPVPQKDPEIQAICEVDPAAEQYLPAAQLTQIEMLEAPAAVLYVPALQYTDSPPTQYDPAEHATHCDADVAPAGPYKPEAHATHTDESEAPTAVLYLPPAHFTGSDKPSGQYDPSGQGVVVTVPAGQ